MDRRRGSRIGLSLHRIGNSAGPAIPAEWRDQFDLEPGEDLVDAEADFEEKTITYHL
jgi:antitoxin component of MazEF toxin-antitoxin module